MKYSNEDIKNYLIDCVGLIEEDLEGLTNKELMAEVERPSELKSYTL